MRRSRLPPWVCLTALLAATVLPGCEDSRTTVQSPSPDKPVEVPAGAENHVSAEPVVEPVPTEPPVAASPGTGITPEETPGETSTAVVAPRKEAAAPAETRPLILTIDTGSVPEQTGNRFDEEPDSSWLRGGKAAGGLADDSGSGKLLPDLFDRKQAREPVSVRSELLIDESSADLSRPVDGAGVVIEYNTE